MMVDDVVLLLLPMLKRGQETGKEGSSFHQKGVRRLSFARCTLFEK
jgi:hypothetical protein